MGPPAPRARRRQLPRRVQALGLAGLAVLGAGTAAAYDLETAPPPPLAVEAVVERAGPGSRFVQPLLVSVTAPGPVQLVDVVARGFQLRVARGTPLGLERRQRLRVDAVVVDCAVETSAPRRVELRVRRGDEPVAAVVVRSDPDVVRALDRLVARTCRRPRG